MATQTKIRITITKTVEYIPEDLKGDKQYIKKYGADAFLGYFPEEEITITEQIITLPERR